MTNPANVPIVASHHFAVGDIVRCGNYMAPSTCVQLTWVSDTKRTVKGRRLQHVYGNHDAGAGSGSARCQKNGFTDDVQHTFQVGYTHDCGGQYYVAIGKVASNPQPAKGPGKKCEVDADGWTRESYYYYYD